MKIITAEKAYVQKKDIEVLFASYDGETPETIMKKQLFKSLFFLDGNKFVEFTEPEEIEFFKNLDWSVNYLTLKDLSTEELLELSNTVEVEINNLEEEYNKLAHNERVFLMNLKRQIELLEFKQSSILDVLEFEKGELDIVLPIDIVAEQILVSVDKPKVKRYLNLPIKVKKN